MQNRKKLQKFKKYRGRISKVERILKMKDYKLYGLTNEQVQNLLFGKNSDSIGNIDIVQGGLMDNYFIDNFNLSLTVGSHRVKARKHLIITEEYLNEWSSSETLILTDNDKKYFKLKRDYLSDYLKENKTDNFLSREEKDYNRFILKEAVKALKK